MKALKFTATCLCGKVYQTSSRKAKTSADGQLCLSLPCGFIPLSTINLAIPQIIGDRVVAEPAGKLAYNGDEPVWLSLETCACEYSLARPGVGYFSTDGWLCKNCGQLHTTHVTEKEYEKEQSIRIAAFKANPELHKEEPCPTPQ